MQKLIALAISATVAIGSFAPAALAPTAGSAATIDSHVAWCEQNYRSYSAATDTYVGIDGYNHRCISPYDGGETRTFGSLAPGFVTPGIVGGSPGRHYSLCPNGKDNYPDCD